MKMQVRSSKRAIRHRWILAAAASLAALLGSVSLAQEVKRGGAIVESWANTTETLDPHVTTARTGAWMTMLFDTLLGYAYNSDTESFEVLPALAESYDFVEPTSLEFVLRQGVTFHDGTAWNAEAAKWNFERARDFENSAIKETMVNVQDVEVVDEYTVRLVLGEPQPDLPLQLTPVNNLGLWIVSPQAVEALGDAEFGRQPVGTGPFQFQRWIPDQQLELVKYPNHWEIGVDGEPLPYVDSYTWRLITDQAVASLELRSGNVNVFFDPAHSDLAILANNPSTKVQKEPGTYRGYPTFYFNPRTESTSPFSSDARLRMAAQYAVDREAMAQALGFGVAEGHHIFGWYPGTPGFDPELTYPFDPERARELLAEAGYADGVDLEVKVVNRTIDVQPLEVLQAMFAEVGINLSIRLMDRLEWIDDGRAGNFEALSHGNTAQPSPLMRQETRCESTFNWAGYCNADVEQLWQQVEVEYDPDEQVRMYREIQQIIYDDAFHLQGFRYPRSVALKENVEGVVNQYNLRYAWIR